MNPWVKRKWIKALRSREYTQGIGYLVYKSSEGELSHCCLGVLACEVAPEFVRKGDYAIAVGGQIGTIPDDLAIMYGLDEATQDRLVEKNDDGEDFNQIADWIEENL